MRTSGRPKLTEVDATTKSHDNAISSPPNAGPSTAAMNGLSSSAADQAVLAASLGVVITAGAQVAARAEHPRGTR